MNTKHNLPSINPITKLIAILALLISPLWASLSMADTNIAGSSSVAVSGYDPVAFFTEGKPVHGDPGISAKHKGATYFFSSKDNRKAFEAAPDKYAPQYGGYCAYGVALGALFPVDVSTWQVRDGKLYLNLNPEILKAFNKDLEKNITKADKNWPGLDR